jgi:hypothetical protein
MFVRQNPADFFGHPGGFWPPIVMGSKQGGHAMEVPKRATSIPSIARPRGSTVQWNEPLDAVLTHMDVTGKDEVFVLEGDRLVGRILRSESSICGRRAIGPVASRPWTRWSEISLGTPP